MKKEPRIVILDYGIGNLNSIQRAFASFGVTTLVSGEVRDLQNINAIVLPGVGSFAAGMRGMKLKDLVKPVQEIAQQGIPMLGICLGAQLLLSVGYEFGEFAGLDIIPGQVVHFPELKDNEKVPHVGWNAICPPAGVTWEATILRPMPPAKRDVYFVHSYVLQPAKRENILANTIYGGYEFCSVVQQGNIYGCQFHPEKSGPIGLGIIEEFIKLASSSNYEA